MNMECIGLLLIALTTLQGIVWTGDYLTVLLYSVITICQNKNDSVYDSV